MICRLITENMSDGFACMDDLDLPWKVMSAMNCGWMALLRGW